MPLKKLLIVVTSSIRDELGIKRALMLQMEVIQDQSYLQEKLLLYSKLTVLKSRPGINKIP